MEWNGIEQNCLRVFGAVCVMCNVSNFAPLPPSCSIVISGIADDGVADVECDVEYDAVGRRRGKGGGGGYIRYGM